MKLKENYKLLLWSLFFGIVCFINNKVITIAGLNFSYLNLTLILPLIFALTKGCFFSAIILLFSLLGFVSWQPFEFNSYFFSYIFWIFWHAIFTFKIAKKNNYHYFSYKIILSEISFRLVTLLFIIIILKHQTDLNHIILYKDFFDNLLIFLFTICLLRVPFIRQNLHISPINSPQKKELFFLKTLVYIIFTVFFITLTASFFDYQKINLFKNILNNISVGALYTRAILVLALILILILVSKRSDSNNKLRKKLEQSENKFQKIIENAPYPIVLLKGKKILYINSQTTKTFGYTLNDLYALNFSKNFINFDPNFIYQIFHFDEISKNSITQNSQVKYYTFKTKHNELKKIICNFSKIDKETICLILNDVTDNYNSQKRIMENETNFRALSENTTDGIIIIDDFGNIIYTNKKTQKESGYCAEELAALRFEDIIQKEDLNTLKLYYTVIAKDFVDSNLYTTTLTKKDGKEIPIEIGFSSTKWNNAETSFFCFRNIEKPELIENKLREKEKQFKLFTSNIIDVIYRKNIKNNNFEFLSQSAFDLTGYTINELKEDPIFYQEKIIEEEYREDYQKIFKQHLINEISYKIKTKNNEIKVVKEQLNYEYDENNNLTTINGIIHDITDEYKAKEAFRTNELILRSVLDSSPDYIFISDSTGKVLAINKAVSSKFNFKSTKLNDLLLLNEIPDQFKELLSQHLKKILTNKKPINFEAKLKNRILDINFFPIIDQNNNVEQISAFLKDITEKRTLEKQISEIKEEERINIGHNLHDGVGQYFTGLGFLAKSLEVDLEKAGLPKNDKLRKLNKLLNEAKNYVRILAKGLYPVNIDENGLIIAISELAVKTRNIFRIEFNLNYNEELSIKNNSIATNIYYIIQEAVNNAIKHSNTNRIDLNIITDKKRNVRIEIEDFGKNIFNENKNKTGLGLKTMKYRANSFGLDFNLIPKKNGGLKIIINFNLEIINNS